jgi:hypothetical protein
MKMYGGVDEVLHASSARVSLRDTLTGELQAPAGLFRRNDPDAQWNVSLKLESI